MKRRYNKKKIIVFIIMIICLIIIGISACKIIKWSIDNKKTSEQIELINSIVEITEEPVIEVEEEEDDDDRLPSYYYDYMNVDFLSVNFNELKRMNSDTVGWIHVYGTNVNYPFVQTSDNEYYLNHSYDKSGNYAGWIFLDYRNDINNLNKNTIIYGHGRLDKTMFGGLRNILTDGWLNDPNHFIIRLSTEKENTIWQVFSVYQIPTTSDYLRTTFYDNDDFIKFTNNLINRSAYKFNVDVKPEDKMLTLSTCHGQLEKVVIHAKLIKKEAR